MNHQNDIPQWKKDQIEKSRQELVKMLAYEHKKKVDNILKKHK